MRIEYEQSFLKDLKKLQKNKLSRTELEGTIQAVKSALNVREIRNLKKIQGFDFFF